MTDRTYIKDGDTTTPVVKLYGSDDAPADLTGATVQMMQSGQSAAACTVVTAADGTVEVPRTAGLVAVGAYKPYQVEFQVTFSDGSIQTFPEYGYYVVAVTADLD